VARKLFATIRYRFSHLDNGLSLKGVLYQSRTIGSEAQVTENMVVNIRRGVVAGSSGPGSSGRLIAFCMGDREAVVGVLWR
jgi:hypothetical protein